MGFSLRLIESIDQSLCCI